MVKGKRPKESQKEPPKESQHESSKESQQEPPKESLSVQTLPPKKRKEKASVAHTSLPAQPVHPPPIKDVPSSKGTQLTILQRSSPKEEPQEDRKRKVKEESSSQSSQEAELDTSFESKKGNKKKGQATLAASPTEGDDAEVKEDASGSEDGLPQLRSPAEHSPTDSTDILAGLLEDVMEEGRSPTPEAAPNTFSDFLKQTGAIKGPLYRWQSAKEFPDLSHLDVSV
jgi:hypothetical protein